MWQSLRMPLTDFSLAERPGFLRLYGGNGLGSRFEQSLIAQRLTEVDANIETVVEFQPECYKQMAGLILYYDYDNHIYLHVTRDEELGHVVTLLMAENKHYAYPAGYIPIPDGPVRLRMALCNGWVSCFFAVGDGAWQMIGEETDGSFLSDEACNEGWFTGTMVGICCQDLIGAKLPADFDWFRMSI